jgi:hypothetical protein
MVSEKQLAANRANALKSRGPVTAEGKARSAMNALRHGMLAKSVLLRCECPAQFRAMLDEFHKEFEPGTASETALVNTMATARWRLMRMSYIESANIDLEYVKQGEPAVVPEDYAAADRAGLAYREAVRNSRVIELVGRAEGRLHRQFDSALARLLRMRADRDVS